jgi:hypothetical protein
LPFPRKKNFFSSFSATLHLQGQWEPGMNRELISFVLNWALYLALYPVAFFWLRRAWRIFIKHDYSEVALKRGASPPNPKRWAPVVGVLHVIAGAVAIWLIVTIPLGRYDFESWIEIAGVTLWTKILLDFIISRQAHPFTFGRKSNK